MVLPTNERASMSEEGESACRDLVVQIAFFNMARCDSQSLGMVRECRGKVGYSTNGVFFSCIHKELP